MLVAAIGREHCFGNVVLRVYWFSEFCLDCVMLLPVLSLLGKTAGSTSAAALLGWNALQVPPFHLAVQCLC